MPQIKDVLITKEVAEDGDLLIMQNPSTGETYNIKIENLLARFLGGSGSTNPSNLSSKTLTYASDGDTNGLFYYLGTSKGTQPWVNPTGNALTLTASSVQAGTLSMLVDRSNSEFYTNQYEGNWVKFDLGDHKIKCNHYSLKSRSSDNYYPRYWKFQGSNDDNTWDDIDTQSNNTLLSQVNQWLTIEVNNNSAYRYIRILSTGVTSSGYNFLVLGEVELYGVYS